MSKKHYNVGKDHPNYGKHLSDEQKKRQSEAMKGHPKMGTFDTF